jgi:hypothetical protein
VYSRPLVDSLEFKIDFAVLAKADVDTWNKRVRSLERVHTESAFI